MVKSITIEPKRSKTKKWYETVTSGESKHDVISAETLMRIDFIVKEYTENGYDSETIKYILPIPDFKTYNKTLFKGAIEKFCNFTATNPDFIYLKSCDDLYPDKHRVCIMKRADMLKISDILYKADYDIAPKNVYLMINLIVKNLKYLSDSIHFNNVDEISPYDWMIFLNFYIDKINNNDTDKPIDFLDHIIKDGEELYGMMFLEDNNVVENRWISTLMNVLAINRPEIKVCIK